MNRIVSITKRVQTADGLRYLPVVVSGNGRLKPDWVVNGAKEERHPEGAYYLDWYEGKKRVRLSVGKDAVGANNRKLRKEAELRAVAAGVVIVPHTDGPDSADAGKNPLAEALSKFLEDTKLTGKPKTYSAYSTSVEYFKRSCHKLYVEDIDRTDMLKFAAFLRDEGLAPRTCWNKFNNIMSFLKANNRRGIVKKNDWPKFVEEEPEIYEKEDLDALMAASTEEEQLWWDFFLMTGFREQEVEYNSWPDLNLTHATAAVRWKPEYGWTPKAYKERTVPIPEKLVVRLKAHKKKAKAGCKLTFPTSGCKPKLDFLDCLKACAKRAGKDANDFWLHKFRATFATWHLWAGVDLRTVQSWLGHSDLESTLRYLKPSRSKETRAKVDATFA